MENIICINADHSNMCSFDLSNEEDESNFQLVRGNIKELYKYAIEARSDSLLGLPPVPTAEPQESYSSREETQGLW